MARFYHFPASVESGHLAGLAVRIRLINGAGSPATVLSVLDHVWRTWRPGAAIWTRPAFTLVAREDWLGRSVRTDRWCYTEWDEVRRGAELYDLQADPRESRNLVKDPKRAHVIEELKKLLHTGPVAKESPVRAAVAAERTRAEP